MLEWAQTGALAVLAGVGYRHIMVAFERTRTRDDAMGKRLVAYEKSNEESHARILANSNERHTEVVERLAHVEALVNGKDT